MDDKKLVKDYLEDRSEDSFRLLYQQKAPRLYQIALRLAGNDEELAWELTQEMWITALKKLDSFEWRSALNTWLTGILINISREQWKKNDKELLIHDGFNNDCFELAIHEEMDLENAIAQLPTGYRRVLILHDVEGYKHREIAEFLRIKEGTSKSQLHQARKALRFLLTENTKR